MPRDQLLAFCSYLIIGFMAAPMVVAAVLIALAALRDRNRFHREPKDRGPIPPKPSRKPLKIVERSAGGYVRVTLLPMRAGHNEHGTASSPEKARADGRTVKNRQR